MAIAKEISSLQTIYQEGEIIFSENDLTRDLYVLLKGKVDVLQKGVHLATLEQSGSFLGEMALLTGEPRSATLRAAEKVAMLKVPPSKIKVLMQHMPDLIMKMAKNLAGMVSNQNKELLKAREATNFYDLIREEMENNANSSLEESVPKMVQQVQQQQHEAMLEVAQSYLKSHVFIDPFLTSIAEVLNLFYQHKIEVNQVDVQNTQLGDRICGLDFMGAMEGSFIFMADDSALNEIGAKLYGDQSNEGLENDTLMELSRRIIGKVKESVPGLHLELSQPQMIDGFEAEESEFVGLKLKTNVGFTSWVHLNK